ncbi:MAG: hypothetical protein JWO08_3969 [Verrucomicrobiaceae bacterium]|nr:hypothetical protein [Verrucomicrobiaceae bacterium]
MLKSLRTLRPAVAIGVAACVLMQMVLALAMAAAPDLHEHLHHDAGDSHHECAVTHLLQGDFGDAAPPPSLAIAPVQAAPSTEVFADVTSASVTPLWLANGVLEHAPPQLG